LPVSMGKPVDAAQRLASGVADMRGAAASASTAQLLTMALETVFKGLGFTRTIAFLRNPDEARYEARLMLGEGVQELASRLVFEDGYQPDVFHAALANDKMIFIENAQDPAFLNKLPRWWKEALPTSHSFMVLPLTVNRRPVGLIYGDWETGLPDAKITYAEVAPLDQLRVLVVKAIEQRRQVDPKWGRAML
jgi:transcriptional regulator with GAF, ATPase, and Fis domain